MDTSDVCYSEEPPPCTKDVGGTWGRCVSQSTSESHSSVCTHNLMQHSTHDTNHVHRIHALPFTVLPIVDPLNVWSTCCPSLEKMFDMNENGVICLHCAVVGGTLPVMKYLVDQYEIDLSLRSTVSGT